MKIKKRFILSVCSLALAGALVPRRADAEHFDILLRVQTAKTQAEAFMDTTPPIGGVNPRPVVHAKAGEVVRINYRMKSGFPHGVMKNVTIHFFVVREEKAGQKPVPNPASEAGIVDESHVMDFAPSAVSTGSLRLKITDPGSYLVRVQSENTHDEHEHEHFSAIDLVVE